MRKRNPFPRLLAAIRRFLPCRRPAPRRAGIRVTPEDAARARKKLEELAIRAESRGGAHG